MLAFSSWLLHCVCSERAFGLPGYWTTCIFQFLFACGAMIGYLVIFADTLSGVLFTCTDWEETHPVLVDRRFILVVGVTVFLFPLCLYRHYGSLAKFAVIKTAAISFLVITVVVLFSQIEVTSNQSHAWKYTEVHSGMVSAVGTISFAFVCHHLTFMARASLRNPTTRRFGATVNLAILGSFSLSIVMAIVGYVTFFESTAGDIIVNYLSLETIRESPVLNVARVLLAFNMVFTYPGELMVARHTIEALIERRRKHSRWVQARSPIHDLHGLRMLHHMDIIAQANSADYWTLSKGCTRPLAEHVALTVLLCMTTTGLALITSDLGRVLDLSGSFCAVFLAFILPAAIRLRIGPTPNDQTDTFTRANCVPFCLLGFGIVAFVAGVGSSLYSLATGGDVLLV